MSQPSPSSASPSPSSALPVVSALAAGALLLGAATPTLSFNGTASGSLFDGGAAMVGVTLLLCAGLLAGLGSKTSAGATGLAGGAGVAAATLSLFFVAFWLSGFKDGGVSPGPGFLGLLAAALLGLVALMMSISQRGAVDQDVFAGAFAVVGVPASVATTIGLMMPPPGSGISFSDANFSFDDAGVQIGYLLYVATPAFVGLVGYASRRRWGVGLVVGGVVAYFWVTAVQVWDIGRPGVLSVGGGGPIGSDVPPVLWLGLGGQLVALFMALVAMGNSTAAGVAPSSSHDHQPPAPPPPHDEQPPPPPPHDEQPPPPPPPAAGAFLPPPGGDAAPTGPVSPPTYPPVTPRAFESAPGEAWWAVEPSEPAAEAVSPFSRPAGPSADDDVTVVTTRDSSPSLSGLVGSTPVLVVHDGRRHVIDGTVVIGRDPVPADGDGQASVLALGEQHLDVSKTHVAVGVDGDGTVWLEDRHSTNGVELVGADGAVSRLVPGRRTPWPERASMALGDLRIELER